MKSLLKNSLIVFLFIIGILVLFLSKKQNDDFNKTIQITPFSISKIILYSSCSGENQNANFQQSNWILNIWQYMDIAIYLDHSGETLNASNTVKKLSLDNFQLSTPNLGTPSLYYLDSLNFSTEIFNRNDKLENSLEFTVLNDENRNQAVQSNTPVFFTDCSNPITLKYVNESIKENYAVPANEPISFDGHLLEMANISLQDLAATIGFTIHIESNDYKHYSYQLSLPIYLENEDSSIYEGNILMEHEYENKQFLQNN